MNKFSKIYLSWRKGKGEPRHMVGEILNQNNDILFRYLDYNKAKKEGFNGYPGLSLEKTEHSNVMDLFSKRLINTERNDSERLLKFWEVDPATKEDKLYLLAMTQGINSIDNFEFLADFDITENMNFVTDLAGTSYYNFDISNLQEGMLLNFEKENHPKDPLAVKVLFKNELVGYIKKSHANVFHKEGFQKIKLQIKHIVNVKDEKKIFVRVFI